QITPASFQVTAGPDNLLTGAVVTLANRRDGAKEESLTATTRRTKIQAAYNATTGTLTLSGSASAADYQQVLQSIQYEDNTLAPSPVARTLTVQLSDGL